MLTRSWVQIEQHVWAAASGGEPPLCQMSAGTTHTLVGTIRCSTGARPALCLPAALISAVLKELHPGQLCPMASWAQSDSGCMGRLERLWHPACSPSRWLPGMRSTGRAMKLTLSGFCSRVSLCACPTAASPSRLLGSAQAAAAACPGTPAAASIIAAAFALRLGAACVRR